MSHREVHAEDRVLAPGPWEDAGRFSVSTLNYGSDVQSLYNFPKKLVIYDATIKRIGTTPGIKEFPTSAKLEIAHMLDAIGVQEIGVNPGWYTNSVWGDADLDAARALCKAGLNLKIIAAMEDKRWLSGDFSYLDQTIDVGVDVIELGLSWRMYRKPGQPKSPTLHELEGMDSDDVDRAVARALEHIRNRGVGVGVLFGPPMRDIHDLEMFSAQLNRYLDCGADRFRMGDVSGMLNPDATRLVVRYLLTHLKREARLTYIVHQPFGMGAAVAIAAASAGAHPETHVNGFAHKGGASLEEVVMALELWYGVDTGIKLDGLADVCSAVERITGVPNHPYKPVVGPAMWAPSWGWQVRELLEGNDGLGTRMAPYNPEVVGSKVNLVWSAACLEPSLVEAKLKQMGLRHDQDDIRTTLAAIHAKIMAIEGYPAWLTDPEVEQICQDSVRVG